jgi:hypothetical protein
MGVYNFPYKNSELTAAIELAPYVPGYLGSLGLFQESGVMRTTVEIEYKENKVSLIPTKPRGSRDSSIVEVGKRKVYPFSIPHIPQEFTLRPDDMPDVRAFGTADGKLEWNQMMAEYLGTAMQNFDATLEFHRMGAINGILLDADGEEIYNLFDIFDITEQNFDVQLDGTVDNAVKILAGQIIRYVQDKLGMTPYSGIRVLCGDAFYDALTFLPEVKDAFYRPKDSLFWRENQVRQAFEYAGIIWENYRGVVGSKEFLGANQARVLPMGVPGMFIKRNGPDDTVSGLNKRGRKVTVTREVLPHEGGVNVRAQMNTLHLCTRPSLLAKITKLAASSSS